MRFLTSRTPICIFLSICIALLPGCGGGGGGGDAATTTPAPSVSTSVVNVTRLSGGIGIVTMPSGDSVSYFAPDAASAPSQALVTSGATKERVYFNSDGTPDRVVDQNSGNYVVVRPRSDIVGADFLAFSATNVFQSGVSVTQSNGTWYSAPVLGGAGQPAVLSGTSSAGNLSYGAQTALPDGAQAILNATTTTASLGTRILDHLIPSAYAQDSGFSKISKQLLLSGVFFLASGVVIGSNLVAAPALAAGAVAIGVVLILAGLATLFSPTLGQPGSAMNALFRSDIVDSDSANPSGGSVIDWAKATAQKAIDNGKQFLNPVANFVVNTGNSLIAGQAAPSPQADTTPPAPSLPPAPTTGSNPPVTAPVTTPAPVPNSPSSPAPSAPSPAAQVCTGTYSMTIKLRDCDNGVFASGALTVKGTTFERGPINGTLTINSPSDINYVVGANNSITCSAAPYIETTVPLVGNQALSNIGSANATVQTLGLSFGYSISNASNSVLGTIVGDGANGVAVTGQFSCAIGAQ